MKCNRSDISEKLVLYAEASISADEAGEIEAHLRECEICRDEERSLRENMGHLREGVLFKRQSECPREELLVELAESPEAVTKSQRNHVEAHLSCCKECNEIFTLLNELGHDLKSSGDIPASNEKMPEYLKEAVGNLYGKKDPEAESFFAKIMRALSLRPRYSFISALAVTLLVIGVLALVFRDYGNLSNQKMPLSDVGKKNMAMREEEKGEDGLAREQLAAGEGEKAGVAEMQASHGKLEQAEVKSERAGSPVADKNKDAASAPQLPEDYKLAQGAGQGGGANAGGGAPRPAFNGNEKMQSTEERVKKAPGDARDENDAGMKNDRIDLDNHNYSIVTKVGENQAEFKAYNTPSPGSDSTGFSHKPVGTDITSKKRAKVALEGSDGFTAHSLPNSEPPSSKQLAAAPSGGGSSGGSGQPQGMIPGMTGVSGQTSREVAPAPGCEMALKKNEDLEKEYREKAKAFLDRKFGKDSMEVFVTVESRGRGSSVEKVDVIIKCRKPVNEAKQKEIESLVRHELGLEADKIKVLNCEVTY